MPFPDDEYRFDGDIYILTSGYTFSAASIITAILKDNAYATIIGEPTACSSVTHNISIFKHIPDELQRYYNTFIG